MHTIDTRALRRLGRTLTGGTWFIIGGVILYSLMTTTPFVAAHSAWRQSGPVLGLMTDAAFIMALMADSTLAKHGVAGLGRWPVTFRWVTGVATLFLNVWNSVEAGDRVGVVVHSIAPILLMILAEVGPVYRLAIARVVAAAEAEAEAARVAELVHAEPEPEPDPDDQAADDDDAPTPLFDVDRPRRHRRPSTARAGSIMARGLALMAEHHGNLTTSDLAESLGCTPRHAQNIAKAYSEPA